MARYRVLSLDGGGCWALIQAKALMTLFGEDTSGWDVLRQFDLAAANSGGSIVLGCLVANLSPKQIYGFFMDEAKRRSMFSPTHNVGDKAAEAFLHFGPKYDTPQKLAGLRAALPGTGDKTLPDAISGCLGHMGKGDPVRLLIVGFDYDRNRAKLFRSAQSGGKPFGVGDVSEVTLAEAIHASTNAPVNYFDAPAELPGDYRYWDGGITGNNNPVLVGVTEAVTTTKQFTEVVALSLGTGTVALPWPDEGEEDSPFVRQTSKTGLLNDLQKLASAILDDPPDMASFVAHVLTGSGATMPQGGPADSQIVRMSPMISPVRDAATNNWTPPAGMSEDDFMALVNMPMDVLEQEQVQQISDYADLWLQDKAPNQPIRMDGDSLKREIGQGTFGAAKAAWDAVAL